MKFKPILKIAGLFLLTLLLTLQIQVNADITQFPLYWDSIAVELDVQENGDMLVTERQKYVFNKEQTNKRYRYIPLNRVDEITEVTVSENDTILPFDSGKEGDRLWIRWLHALNPPESDTFVLKYRVIGGLQLKSDNTQVYWKAIFSDRSAPIQNARVTVRLPESLAGKIDSYTYYADNISVSSEIIGDRTIEFIAQKPIPKGSGMEVKVTFPQNILNMSKPKWQKYRWLKSIKNRNIPWLAIILMIFWIPISIIFGQKGSSSSSTYYGGSSGSGSEGGGGGGGGGDGGGGGGGGG